MRLRFNFHVSKHNAIVAVLALGESFPFNTSVILFLLFNNVEREREREKNELASTCVP